MLLSSAVVLIVLLAVLPTVNTVGICSIQDIAVMAHEACGFRKPRSVGAANSLTEGDGDISRLFPESPRWRRTQGDNVRYANLEKIIANKWKTNRSRGRLPSLMDLINPRDIDVRAASRHENIRQLHETCCTGQCTEEEMELWCYLLFVI
ncbi:Uncharacterised protein g6956 [Pycnogonum litorale]